MRTARSHLVAAACPLLLATSLFSVSHGGTEELPSTDSVAEDTGYLTFFLDNDLFAGTDQNYTNGARLSYITEGRPILDIPFIQQNLHRFCADGEGKSVLQRIWGFRDPRKVEYSYGFALTQLMFTPESLTALTAPPGERPYAGGLALASLSMHVDRESAQHSRNLHWRRGPTRTSPGNPRLHPQFT